METTYKKGIVRNIDKEKVKSIINDVKKESNAVKFHDRVNQMISEFERECFKDSFVAITNSKYGSSDPVWFAVLVSKTDSSENPLFTCETWLKVFKLEKK